MAEGNPIENAKLMQFAKSLADPNFCLSVPPEAKRVLRDLIEYAEGLAATHRKELARAINAHRALHPVYGSTAACHGGIGGQVITVHCAEVCQSPKHREENSEWLAVEQAYFNTYQEGKK